MCRNVDSLGMHQNAKTNMVTSKQWHYIILNKKGKLIASQRMPHYCSHSHQVYLDAQLFAFACTHPIKKSIFAIRSVYRKHCLHAKVNSCSAVALNKTYFFSLNFDRFLWKMLHIININAKKQKC